MNHIDVEKQQKIEARRHQKALGLHRKKPCPFTAITHQNKRHFAAGVWSFRSHWSWMKVGRKLLFYLHVICLCPDYQCPVFSSETCPFICNCCYSLKRHLETGLRHSMSHGTGRRTWSVIALIGTKLMFFTHEISSHITYVLARTSTVIPVHRYVPVSYH